MKHRGKIQTHPASVRQIIYKREYIPPSRGYERIKRNSRRTTSSSRHSSRKVRAIADELKAWLARPRLKARYVALRRFNVTGERLSAIFPVIRASASSPATPFFLLSLCSFSRSRRTLLSPFLFAFQTPLSFFFIRTRENKRLRRTVAKGGSARRSLIDTFNHYLCSDLANDTRA